MLVSTYKRYAFFYLFLVMFTPLIAQEWTLQQCIDTAQIYNKSLQIGRNNISIGEQREIEVKGNLIPKLSLNADYKYFLNLPYQLMPLSTFNPLASEGQFKEAQFGVPHNLNASLQMTMPLYNPQLYGNIQNSHIAKELNELQFQKTAEQIVYDISILYYNAQILQHQLVFIDSNLSNADVLLKNLELLNEQLLVKKTDVDKVKLQKDQLKTQRENVINKFDQLLNALKIAMGIPIEKDIFINREILFKQGSEYSNVQILDLNIITTQNKLLKNELNILNKSRYLPTLNLIATYGTTGFGYDVKPDNFLKFYPVGFASVQFSYPIFNGTVTQRKISIKKLELINNDLQTALISEKNKMEIENALRQRGVAQKIIVTTENQILFAQNIFKQISLQQSQGTASLAEVLLADNALRETQQNYLSAIIDYLKAELELKKYSGSINLN